MESSIEETITNFDLNFLDHANQPVVTGVPNNVSHSDNLANAIPVSKFEKLRRAVLRVKKKTVATTFLIQKFYEKKDLLEMRERQVLTAKEECRQLSIQYKVSEDKFSQLHQENGALQMENKDLRSKIVALELQIEAMKSHCNQLQMLANENETRIQSLTLENSLEKSEAKVNMKKVTSLEKDNVEHIQNLLILAEVVLGRRQANKRDRAILYKYQKLEVKKLEILTEDEDDNSDDVFEDIPSSPGFDIASSYQNGKNSIMAALSSCVENISDDADRDSDSGTEVISNDTGRGSSLAFSGSDKCFPSPDYCNSDTPLSPENKPPYVNVATIKTHSTVDRSVSPIQFDEIIEIVTSRMHSPPSGSPCKNNIAHKSTSTIASPKTMRSSLTVDVATSPRKNNVAHQSTSPIASPKTMHRSSTVDVANSPNPKNNVVHKSTNTIASPKAIRRSSKVDEATGPGKNDVAHLSTSPIVSSKTMRRSQTVDVATSPRENNVAHKSTNTIASPEAIRKSSKVDEATGPGQNDVTHQSTSPIASSKTMHRSPTVDVAPSPRENNVAHQSKIPIASPTTPRSQEVDVAMSTCDNTLQSTIPVVSLKSNTDQPKSAKHDQFPPADPITEITTVSSGKAVGDECNVGEYLNSITSDESDIESNTNEDSEIAMIFSHMRMNHALITPIPRTPSKSLDNNNRCGPCVFKVNEQSHVCCSETRENCNVLQTQVLNLNKEVSLLKSIMSIHLPVNVDSLMNNYDDVHTTTSSDNNRSNSVLGPAHASNQSTPVIGSRIPNALDVQENIEISLTADVEANDNRITKTVVFENDVCAQEQTLTEENLVCSASLPTRRFGLSMTTENNSSNNALDLAPDASHFDTSENTSVLGNRIPNADNIQEKVIRADVETIYKRMSKAIVFEEDDSESEIPLSEYLASSASDRCPVQTRSLRTRKLTKLEKMRNKLKPKSKIKIAQPIRKLRSSKLLGTKKIRDTLLKPESASLYNKAAYEKAVKIMKEIKNKENDKVPKKQIRRIKRDKVISSSIDYIETSRGRPVKNDCNEKSVIATNSPSSDNCRGAIPKQSHKIPSKVKITHENKETVAKIHVIGDECHKQKSKKLVIDYNNIVDEDPGKRSETRTEAIGYESYRPTRSCKMSKRHDVENTSAVVKETEGSPGHDKREIIQKPTLNTRRKRRSADKQLIEENKRILRSSILPSNNDEVVPLIVHVNLERNPGVEKLIKVNSPNGLSDKSDTSKIPELHSTLTSYNDLNMFREVDTVPKKKPRLSEHKIQNPRESVFCTRLEKYGISKMKHNPPKNPPDDVIETYKQKIEDAITGIIEVPQEKAKGAMDKFIKHIKSWNLKHFMLGLLKFLADFERSTELLSKRSCANSPEMTKSEQILLYVATQLQNFWPNVNFVNRLLETIEYTLFRLNNTPEFYAIESLSHFYALLCLRIKSRNRLRMFMLDAMYCMQFKAIPLIKNCLEVWKHSLPLAHMGIAKNPLVTCVVYLLHFYKCEDKWNRVQVVRRMLNRAYGYQFSEWNEPKILEMIRNAIKTLRDIPIERKMLRMSLILLSKRHGPRWCEKNVIKGVLQPLIDDGNAPEIIKVFCVSMLGPLLRPYPLDMKINVEMAIHNLLDRLERNPSPKMEEAIYASLIYTSKHSQNIILQAMLRWQPKQISPEMESLVRDFVKSRPLKGWQITLSKTSLVCT